MNTIRRLAKNSIASLLVQACVPAVTFVLVLVIARRLGTDSLGEYSAALSMYYIFQAVSTFGLTLLITRDVAQDKSIANKYMVNGSYIAVFLSAVASVAMCVSVNWVSSVPTVRYSAYILSSSLVFYSLSVAFQSVCRAYERLEYVAICQLAASVLKVGLGVPLLLKGHGILAIMFVILGSTILNAVMSLYFSLRLVPGPLGKFDPQFCKKALMAVPDFGFIIILSTVRFNIDVIMLTRLLGVEDVGYYSAGLKLANIFKLGISCYIMALQPIVFRVFASSAEKFESACRESTRYLVIGVLPIVVGGALISQPLIGLVFGEEYLPSSSAFSILLWTLPFYSLNQIFANALMAGNHQRNNLQANLIGVIAGIILNLVLILQLGYIGAAISTVLTTVIVAASQYWFVSKKLFRIRFFKLLWKPVVSVCMMAGIMMLTKDFNMFVVFSVAVVAYPVCLIILREFTEKDGELVRGLIRG